MPIRKTKTKGTRHQKIAPRPSQSAPPAPPSFATPQSHPPRPPPSAPPAPITLPTSQPYSPLPPQLANKMVSLIHLSSQIESLSQALSYGLFATPSDQHSATTRMTTLRTKYTAFRSHVDSELTSLGYLPSHTNTPLPPSSSSSSSKQPPKLITNVSKTPSPYTAWHKHKYGPTSPKYTVDKALKRKAEKMASTPGGMRAGKKQRGEVESDYVETDCEGEEEEKKKKTKGGKVEEEDTRSPPGPILAAVVPLAGDERRRMRGWNWAGAVKRGGCGREVVESPMGTRRVGVW